MSSQNAETKSFKTLSSSSSTNPIIERLRAATSSIPKFDALTSSAALSSFLSTASARARTFTTDLRSKLSNLSAQYNTYSGYSAIEQLKTRIGSLETSLDSARTLAATAKKTYLTAVQNRSASQRETNDLLSRKNSWSESDLSRYTELLRKEHALSKEELEAEKELEKTEADVQSAFDDLMKAVMVRYHEEQIWSDRMRGMSTYGSLVVAGLNAFLFILAILLVEPYKRKKLAQTFESRLVAAEEQSRQLILASVDQFQLSLNNALALDAASASTSAADSQVGEPISTATGEPTTVTPPSSVLQPEPTEPEQAEEKTEATPPITHLDPDSARQDALINRLQRHRQHQREEEERLVFASTVGVVVGATLSLIISACWS